MGTESIPWGLHLAARSIGGLGKDQSLNTILLASNFSTAANIYVIFLFIYLFVYLKSALCIYLHWISPSC